MCSAYKLIEARFVLGMINLGVNLEVRQEAYVPYGCIHSMSANNQDFNGFFDFV